MKRFLFTILLMLASLAPLKADEGWTLFWADEFNYTGHPDPSKWGYERGWLRNHELQYYTKGRLENARVENGNLVIEGRKEDFMVTGGRLAHYTSASLIAKIPSGWMYGRLEVRAQLPQGRGVWPAIWTLGVAEPKVGWPACGEIDVMEFVGKEPGKVNATLHYRVDGAHKANHKDFPIAQPSDAFHIYAMEWYPDRINFFLDGVKYHSVATDEAGLGPENPFRKPHKLLLNMALGGSWGGDMDDTMLPQKYLIDYVRIYKSTATSGN